MGEKIAIHHHRDGAWHGISWSEMEGMVLRVGAALLGEGVDARESVVLLSPNRLEWIVCDLAIQAIGAVTVPIYPNSTAAVARTIVRDCGARVALVADSALGGRLSGAEVKVLAMDSQIAEWLTAPLSEGSEAAVKARSAAIDREDGCTIIYTSGTTGEPKGVVLLHRNFVDMARASMRTFELSSDDHTLSFLPYAHVFERVSSIFVGITAGGTLHISRGAETLAEDLQVARPTVMCAVPRIYEKVHARVMARVRTEPPWRRTLFNWAVGQGRRRAVSASAGLGYWLADRLVLARLRQTLTGGRLRFFVSGGAPLAHDIEEFFWALGIPILQGWGLTETSSGATTNRPGRHRVGTVGWPLDGVEVKLAEDGEILVRGPGVMREYYRQPAATAAVLVEGWFHTGDVGRLDPDGCVHITDRKKDMIKTAGGKFIAPQPLEARLQEDSVIERVVLIGDQRPYVVALVVPDWAMLAAEGHDGDPEVLKDDEGVRALIQARFDAVNADLASYETIKHFRLLAQDFSIEAGELTPKLSIRRREIQERYSKLIQEMYAEARK